jgi:hypothetical protein
VLVDSVGEPAPLPPVDVAGWIDQFGTPSRIEQTAEKRSRLGRTSLQEPSLCHFRWSWELLRYTISFRFFSVSIPGMRCGPHVTIGVPLDAGVPMKAAPLDGDCEWGCR